MSGTANIYYPNKYYTTNDNSTKTKQIYLGDALIATIENGNPHYVATDHLGGTNVVTDGKGKQEEVLDYYPFGGVRLNEKVGTFENKRQYIGEYFDADTGLNYLNARYYQNTTGRFLSQDPSSLALGDEEQIKAMTKMKLKRVLMDPQSLNSYSYSGNNPITLSDPNGKWTQGQVDGANYLYESSPVWRYAMSNPIKSGVIIGAGAGVAVYGAAAGATALSVEYLGGIGTTCMSLCAKASTMLQNNQAAGRIGEAASGILKNSTRIESLSNTAKYRIPDGLNSTGKLLSEVKNVKYQSLTNQIKDFVQYSQQNDYRFDLYTRQNTQLSTQLQKLVTEGKITHKIIGN